MRKYRITYRRRRFIPERKGWLFWHGFGLGFGGKLSFETLPKALNFIREQVDLDHPVQRIPVRIEPATPEPTYAPGLDAWGRGESLL